MSCETETGELLRTNGRRLTPQRQRVAVALQHAGGHRTVEELHELVARSSQDSPMALSTVYRALTTLQELRLVCEVDMGGRAAFEWVDRSHPHHHLTCQQCGAMSDLDPTLLDELRRSIRAKSGFEAFLDHLAIGGECAHCQQAASKTQSRQQR